MSSFRRRLMMSVKKQDEYTELKYLASNGTQYIDTEFKPNSNTRIIARAKMTYFMTTFVFGARISAANSTFAGLMERQAANSGYYRLDYSKALNRVVTITNNDNDIHYFEIDKGKLFFDNVEYQSKFTTKFQSDYNLVLFGINTARDYYKVK